MKNKKLQALIILSLALVFVSCGSSTHVLRTGPTITPVPEKASSGEAVQTTQPGEEEIKELINAAAERMREAFPFEKEFALSDDMNSELIKYDDGSSDVVVCDERDRETARIMYDKNHKLEKQIYNIYEDGELVMGAKYEDTSLASYFETAEKNGKIYVELVVSEQKITARIADSGGNITEYDISE